MMRLPDRTRRTLPLDVSDPTLNISHSFVTYSGQLDGLEEPIRTRSRRHQSDPAGTVGFFKLEPE